MSINKKIIELYNKMKSSNVVPTIEDLSSVSASESVKNKPLRWNASKNAFDVTYPVFNFVLATTEAATLKYMLAVPGIKEIFNNWLKKAHTDVGALQRLYSSSALETTYWNTAHTKTTWQNENPNYSNAFTYSDSQNAIIVEQDWAPPKFFVSPKAEYYNFYLKLGFTSWDDDGVVLLPGFMTDSKGVEHTLSFFRSARSGFGEWSEPSTGWALIYDIGNPTQDILVNYKNKVTDGGGWINFSMRKIGNKLIGKTCQSGQTTDDENATITYTLPKTRPSSMPQEEYDNIYYMLNNPIQIGLGSVNMPVTFKILETEGAFEIPKIVSLDTNVVYSYDLKKNDWVEDGTVEDKIKAQSFLYNERSGVLFYYFTKGQYVQVYPPLADDGKPYVMPAPFLMLSNSNYKMMDIYPTKYKTMTSVNDELKLAGMTGLKLDYLTTMESMFQNCNKIKTIPVLSTEKITNMKNMFLNCYEFNEIPQLDTRKVTTMEGMFKNCKKIKEIKNMSTEIVTNMADMFNGCESLTEVPQYNMSKVTNISGMFGNCIALTTVPALNLSKVLSLKDLFNGCVKLNSVGELNIASATSADSMFKSCIELPTITAPINTTALTTTANMFRGCKALTSVPLFDTLNVTNMSGMFSGCTSLTKFEKLDTSNVTDFSEMFSTCVALTDIDALKITDKATSTQSLFYGCTVLTNIPKMDTSNVLDMSGMFYGCTSLTKIQPDSKVSDALDPLKLVTKPTPLNMSSVTNTASMFEGCTSITEIPEINMPNCEKAMNMFKGCSNLKKIDGVFDIGKYSTACVNMFADCPKLKGVKLKNVPEDFNIVDLGLSEGQYEIVE